MAALENEHTALYISLSFLALLACFHLCPPFLSMSCLFSSLLWCISVISCPVLLRSTMDSEPDWCHPGWKGCWNQFRVWQIGRWQRGVTICRRWYGLELGGIVARLPETAAETWNVQCRSLQYHLWKLWEQQACPGLCVNWPRRLLSLPSNSKLTLVAS